MEIKEIQDKYNNTKIWLVKKSKCNHYYLNQRNGNNKLNRGFIRTTKRNLISIGIL